MVVVWMIPQSAAHMIGWHVVDVIEHIAWIHRHHHIVCWRCGGNDESMQMKIRRVWRAEQAAGALGLLKGRFVVLLLQLCQCERLTKAGVIQNLLLLVVIGAEAVDQGDLQSLPWLNP